MQLGTVALLISSIIIRLLKVDPTKYKWNVSKMVSNLELI